MLAGFVLELQPNASTEPAIHRLHEDQPQIRRGRGIMSTLITDHPEGLARSGQALALSVPPDVRLRVSDEDFWRLCQENPDLRLERTAEGELIVMPPAPPDGSQRNEPECSTLELEPASQPRRGVRLLGRLHASQLGDPRPGRFMDDLGALGAIPQEERLKFSHVCPDFVVELRSTSNTMKDLRDKMREYLAQGARLGWLIDPISGTVESTARAGPSRPWRSPRPSRAKTSCQGSCSTSKGILFD